MPFDPDIVVTGPEAWNIELIAETKLSSSQLDESERQLKAYMASMNIPIGLLVTPNRLRLYSDRYVSPPEDSIALVGEFDVTDLLNFQPFAEDPRSARAFEQIVQNWLESLSTESGRGKLPADLRRAAQSYIVPALEQGAVRAAHPR